METGLIQFIKISRREAGLTQPECATKAGVSVAFLRNLEQGKKSLQMDKVNRVLKLFGTELGVVPIAPFTIELWTTDKGKEIPAK